MFFKFFGTFFLDKELYINIKKILVARDFYNDPILRPSREIYVAHNQKDKKE